MSTCETVMMTPVEAKILRETANFELQRPISANNVVRLRAEMEAGRFIPGTPIYLAVLPDKSMLALNGNHTLEAIVQTDKPIELTLIYQPVRNQLEAAAIYARLDLQKMRSWRDALRAFGAEDMLASSTVWTAQFAAAFGQIVSGFDDAHRLDRERADLVNVQVARSRDLRLRLMKEAATAAQLYVAAVGGSTGFKQIFKRASVFGVGIEIMRYQPSAGSEFFATAAADDGLRMGDPQRALLRYLRDTPSQGSSIRTQTARAVATAWNAFFQKKRVEFIKPNQLREFHLAGTPWDGKFDPIAAYLPELRKPPAPKTALRKIRTGVDHLGKAVAIHE